MARREPNTIAARNRIKPRSDNRGSVYPGAVTQVFCQFRIRCASVVQLPYSQQRRIWQGVEQCRGVRREEEQELCR
jgi:hypothetical protein